MNKTERSTSIHGGTPGTSCEGWASINSIFVGRQQVASSFSGTRIARIAETGEMVGASFLSICVTVGAAPVAYDYLGDLGVKS